MSHSTNQDVQTPAEVPFPPTSPEPPGPAPETEKAGRSPHPNVPVARPAPKTRVRVEDEVEEPEEIFTPTTLKAWSISLVLHSLLLLILALIVLAPTNRRTQVLETKLAGDPFGEDFGEQLESGLSMDTPLAMPLTPLAPALETPTLKSPTAIDPNLIPSAASASNAGGVALANPGNAGSGDGFGVARFGTGGETINGIRVKVGDPQFTLIWDNRADIDIHVQEPGGAHIYWENRNGNFGGELDVDDVDGYGPENVYWVQGQGPPGEYKWYVHYYGGLGGISIPTRWKVRLKHNNQLTVYEGRLRHIGEKSETFSFTIDRDGNANVEPAQDQP